MRSLAAHISDLVAQLERSHGPGELECMARIDALVELLPSGSGIDAGTDIDIAKSTPEKLVLTFGYHHMNEHGYYDGWTHHTVVATPSFDGIDVRITGRNRNDIKDYLGELYWHALSQKA